MIMTPHLTESQRLAAKPVLSESGWSERYVANYYTHLLFAGPSAAERQLERPRDRIMMRSIMEAPEFSVLPGFLDLTAEQLSALITGFDERILAERFGVIHPRTLDQRMAEVGVNPLLRAPRLAYQELFASRSKSDREKLAGDLGVSVDVINRQREEMEQSLEAVKQYTEMRWTSLTGPALTFTYGVAGGAWMARHWSVEKQNVRDRLAGEFRKHRRAHDIFSEPVFIQEEQEKEAAMRSAQLKRSARAKNTTRPGSGSRPKVERPMTTALEDGWAVLNADTVDHLLDSGASGNDIAHAYAVSSADLIERFPKLAYRLERDSTSHDAETDPVVDPVVDPVEAPSEAEVVDLAPERNETPVPERVSAPVEGHGETGSSDVLNDADPDLNAITWTFAPVDRIEAMLLDEGADAAAEHFGVTVDDIYARVLGLSRHEEGRSMRNE